MSYILYVADTETTGLDPKIHDVVEISMCRVFLDSDREEEQRTWHLKPLNPDKIDDEALEINKLKREDLCGLTPAGREKYREPIEVVAEIERWIMEDDMSSFDRVLLGQNIIFDKDMLESLWKKLDCFNTFPFEIKNNNRLIDTKQLAILIDLCTGTRRQFYNLANLVKDFGVKKGKAHIASEDVRMTKDLFMAQFQPIKGAIAEAFKNNYQSTTSS